MLLDDLRARIGTDCLVTDRDVLASYAQDEAEWAPFGQPAVVVLTTGTAVVGTGDPGPAPVGPGSLQARMAAVGEWLWDRLTVAAEAGARQP